MDELTKERDGLSKEKEQLEGKLKEELKKRRDAQEEKQDLLERCDRQRETIKDNSKELIDLQSQVANYEEKLLMTEQQLI